jgi:hypothetical protein
MVFVLRAGLRNGIGLAQLAGDMSRGQLRYWEILVAHDELNTCTARCTLKRWAAVPY